ncbi:phosphodiesterase [Acidihalobacter prosperus]|uniref:Phosphodiesterase n=1 Tax=Acidihalobacter prosperus TaxID=160660 RepID=A0A1A6C459_9GAMM|nr:phosphodiesterase [Acidihalobacter prosperus]OBS09348.1 phosphodiesterase [Acidihalobacter prosperus]
MKLIQITDTHFVPPGQTLYALDPRARLDACIADINAHHRDAALCVITGDLVHRGETEAYHALRESLAALSIPLQLVIGNHDHRGRFREAFPETPVDAEGFVQSWRDTEAGRLLFLDTVADGRHVGHYCAARQRWLREALADAGQRPVYAFMHHPPFDVGLPSCDVLGIDNAGEARAALRSAGDLRHIFFGHVHRPISGGWRGVSFTTLRATAHQTLLDFEAEEERYFSHEPPAYAVVLLDEAQVTVHFHDYLDRSERVPVRGG